MAGACGVADYAGPVSVDAPGARSQWRAVTVAVVMVTARDGMMARYDARATNPA